jgi:hypothetical protein
MAMLSTVERRLCQQDEAESISEALRRAMRHMTLTTLISATPTVANVLTAEVVLNVLVALAVALMVLLTVLIIDESIYYISPYSVLPQYPTSILGNNYT